MAKDSWHLSVLCEVFLQLVRTPPSHTALETALHIPLQILPQTDPATGKQGPSLLFLSTEPKCLTLRVSVVRRNKETPLKDEFHPWDLLPQSVQLLIKDRGGVRCLQSDEENRDQNAN